MFSTHQAPEEGGWEHHQLHSMSSAGAYCQAVFNKKGDAVDFVYIEVNENFKRVFGLRNFVGLKASETIPDIDNGRKEFITRHLEVARTGITDTFVYCYETTDTWYTVTVSSHQQWFFTAVIEKSNDEQLAQKELRLSNELLEEAVVAAQVGIWDWFIETGEVFVNEIWAGIIGYTLKELEPLTIKRWKDLLHPDDLMHANARILRYFNGNTDGYALEFRMRHRHKDGHWVWINCSTKIVSRTPEGKPLRLLGVHTYINRQKEREAETQKQEDQFRLFFDNHSEPMLCIEPNEGAIVNANQAAVNFYGWSRDELCRMSIEHINTLPMVQILAQMRMAGSSNQVRLPSVHRTATGSLREVEVYTSTIPVEGQLLLYLVIHDVTKRKQAEEKIRSLACLAKAISDCNQTLIHVTNEATLLKKVCNILVNIGGYRMTWAGYAEHDEAKSVSIIAEAGYFKGYPHHYLLSWGDVPQGRGPTGTAIRTGRVSVVHDTETDPAFVLWRRDARKYGFASHLVLPLTADKGAFGAIGIYAAKSYAFESEEVELLLTLAQNISFGILLLRHRNTAEFSRKDRELLQHQLFKKQNDKHLLLREKDQKDIKRAKSGEKDALLLAKETIAELNKREKLLQEALASERLIAEQQRRFLSMISHEYRTPIAIINGNLDILMLNEKTSSTIQANATDKMKRAVKRLMEVMDTSLEKCRFFDDANSAAYQSLDLFAILCDQLADAAVLWPDRFYCSAEGIKGVRVLADQTFLNVTIFNLLDNARKYSPPNSPIRVDCRKDGTNVAILVVNQANTASPFIAEDLFKKYERGSNSANTGGAGMGLWLVREIVEMYQGTITIESEPQGIVATLRLPFVDDATSYQSN